MSIGAAIEPACVSFGLFKPMHRRLTRLMPDRAGEQLN
jgi:hypothetical protein